MSDLNSFFNSGPGTRLQFITDLAALIASMTIIQGTILILTSDMDNDTQRPDYFISKLAQFMVFLIPLIVLRRRSNVWKIPSLFVVAILGTVLSFVVITTVAVLNDTRYLSAHPEKFFERIIILGFDAFLIVFGILNAVFLTLAYFFRLITGIVKRSRIKLK
jgi:hypothetical protein